MITPQQAQDMLHYESADGFTAPELSLTAELAAHAPVMAEQIANQQYEYAVQNAETGAWLREEGDGVVVRTSDPSAADWSTSFKEVEAYAVWMTGEELTEHRVMARLTSTPEVVE